MDCLLRDAGLDHIIFYDNNSTMSFADLILRCLGLWR